MSLRDYFASQAMPIMLNQIYELMKLGSSDTNSLKDDSDTFKEVARISYQLADAMLKEREKQ